MRRAAILASALLVLSVVAGPARAEAPGVVSGVVALDVVGPALSGLGPVVVFLEPQEPLPAPAEPLPPTEIVQKNARFAPSFHVVTVGQRVVMPNADAIYHNVFSFSRPNDFDLGLYAAGESREVRFEHAGVVKTYCSIHESMNGTILVVPTRHFAVVDAEGRFRLEGVPAGRYQLWVWCEKLPPTSRALTVVAGTSQLLTLPLIPSA